MGWLCGMNGLFISFIFITNMRYVLTFIWLGALLHANANDTLTRAEIYNFSVGDTFDYMDRNYYETDGQLVETNSITYSRYIVTNISWSSDSSEKYIVRSKVYPLPVTSETIDLTNLNGYEVIMDTVVYANSEYGPNYYQIDSLTYFNQPANALFYWIPVNYEANFYARGLGEVLTYISGCPMSICYDSIALIYYSGVNGVFGTPYTALPTAISNLQFPSEEITVFPSISSGRFAVQIPGEINLPINFSIYDLQGRMVRQFVVSRSTSEIDIGGVARGIYIWKSITVNTPVQTGKVIVE